MPNRFALAALAALFLAGCASQDATGPTDSGTQPALNLGYLGAHGSPGAVYTESNAADGNAVLVFDRAADGSLGAVRSFPTGGLGTGADLGSQGAVALIDHRWLLAVDAGSNELSVFRIAGDRVVQTDRVPSGGTMPISVTSWLNIVYVLNAGGDGNVTGFRLTPRGKLQAIPASTRGVGGAGAGPAQVGFSPLGVLVISEKAANQLVTYRLGFGGTLYGMKVQASAGGVPFGFAFAGFNTLVVSEAAISSASSYRIGFDGSLNVVSAAVPDLGGAACWAATSKDGRYAYIINAATNTVSGYGIGRDASLSLLEANGVSGTTLAHPLDGAVSDDGRFLYVIDTAGQAISEFAIGHDGSLTSLGTMSGIPSSARGLAAN
jgi:6-phosphogluconolactonase